MQARLSKIKAYLRQVVPAVWQEKMVHLRQAIVDNLPHGFVEQINAGMIGYVVPHRLFPSGYHCNPQLPLPFVNIAAKSRHIGFYHMGIYASADLLKWFVNEYPKYCKLKLDMGKSCVRFKKTENIPYELIGELMRKISVKNWIQNYSGNV